VSSFVKQRLLVGMTMQQQHQQRHILQSTLQLQQGQLQLKQTVEGIGLMRHSGRASCSSSKVTHQADPSAAAAAAVADQAMPQAAAPAGPCSSTGDSSSGEKVHMVSANFVLKTNTVSTVPKLVHLFEFGWPVGGPGMIRTYSALRSVHMSGKGPNKQQFELMGVGYRFVTVIAGENNISTQQAAEVIELWRHNKPASIRTDGTVHESSSGRGSSSSTVGGACRMLPVLPFFNESLSAKSHMSLCTLCKTARSYPAVQQLADSQKQKAGRAGATASNARKRQRSEEGGSVDA
jgi:hypothetical protein